MGLGLVELGAGGRGQRLGRGGEGSGVCGRIQLGKFPITGV